MWLYYLIDIFNLLTGHLYQPTTMMLSANNVLIHFFVGQLEWACQGNFMVVIYTIYGGPFTTSMD